MPELRKDPVTERWVIISTQRARRPGNFVTRDDNLKDDEGPNCKFCHFSEEPIVKEPVTVIPYLNSFLSTDQKYVHKGKGLYDVVNGFGTHEVVIETDQHEANIADFSVAQITKVIETYKNRIIELSKNRDFQYIVAYKNYGEVAGSRNIAHARSHIIATPVVSARLKEIYEGSCRYYDQNNQCIYCDLINKEKENNVRILSENEHFIAVVPYAARFLFEVMILPKSHHSDFAHDIFGKEHDLAQILKEVLLRYKVGLDNPAYNYVIQTAPLRHEDDNQWKNMEQAYHWHIEIMPRLTQIAGFEKGTGFYINAISPEQETTYLKEVDINE